MVSSWSKVKLEDNTVLYIMYYLSLPTYYVFSKTKISPNKISIFSFLLTLIGCYFLFQGSFIYFCILTILGLIMDLNDGQIARSKNQVRNNNLAVDHYLDLVKIGLIITSASTYLNSDLIFVYSNIFLVLFYLYTILNHDSNKYRSETLKSSFEQLKFKSKLKSGLWKSATGFDAPIYLALLLSIWNSRIYTFWLTYSLILISIQIFKMATLLYNTKKLIGKK